MGENDHKTLIPMLLAHKGVDVNVRACEYGSAPLHSAVGFGHIIATKALLGHPSIDVNATDEQGFHALHFAVEDRDPEMVRLLLGAKGIDVTLKNEDGLCALEHATKRKRGDCLNESEIIAMLESRNNSAGA